MHASSGKGMTHSTSDKKCRAYRNKQQALAQRELDTDEAGNAAPRGVPRDGFLHDLEGYRPIHVPRVHPGHAGRDGQPTENKDLHRQLSAQRSVAYRRVQTSSGEKVIKAMFTCGS